MKLSHLSLPVVAVRATREFFERYSDFAVHSRRNLTGLSA
jgi:hypothetical protein